MNKYQVVLDYTQVVTFDVEGMDEDEAISTARKLYSEEVVSEADRLLYKRTFPNVNYRSSAIELIECFEYEEGN